MQRRRLYLDMNALLDAMDTDDELTSWYLDLQTGEISLWMDPILSEEPPEFDPVDPRYALIPSSASQGADQVGRRDAEAVGAVEAAEDDRQARLLALALSWLAQLGIDPEYELRRAPPVHPLGLPNPTPGQAQIGLLELLMLGAPGDNERPGSPPDREDPDTSEPRRLLRRFNARDEEQAGKLFVRVAREITEHDGQPWRSHLIEGKTQYSAGRLHLAQVGRTVQLEVEFAPAVLALFAR